MWNAPAIEQCRLLTIAATWRLIGSRRIVTSDTYQNIGGFRIREPAADVERQRRIVADRLAAGVCAECGDPRLATTRLCREMPRLGAGSRATPTAAVGRGRAVVRQANWRRTAGGSPAERRSNQPLSPRVMRRSL